MSSANIRVSGLYHPARPWIKVAGTWQGALTGWVKVAGVWEQFFVNFSGSTSTYNTSGSFTDTIPSGALSVVIEMWGGSAGGGAGHAGGVGAAGGGGGGGSGGYSKTVLTLTAADWGKTLAVVIGAGIATSTISAGTKALTTMTANGGTIGGTTTTSAAGVGGAGGTASGGNTTNTTGNAGANGASGIETGGVGGAGIVGTNGTGPTGGHGQNTISAGATGLAILKYSP